MGSKVEILLIVDNHPEYGEFEDEFNVFILMSYVGNPNNSSNNNSNSNNILAIIVPNSNNIITIIIVVTLIILFLPIPGTHWKSRK